jgi:acylphosphatase
VPAYLLIIRGKVQGVYYRAFAQQAARERGVTGWVRNMPDGCVQAHVQHSDEAVLRGLLDVLAGGPPAAEVQSVMHSSVPEAPHSGFEIAS